MSMLISEYKNGITEPVLSSLGCEIAGRSIHAAETTGASRERLQTEAQCHRCGYGLPLKRPESI